MNIVERLMSYDPSAIVKPTRLFPMTLKKLGGAVFEFPLTALDTDRACQIQDKQFRFIASGNLEMENNMYEAKVDTLMFGCPGVFKNAEVLKHFNVAGGADLISKLMTPGEVDELKAAIDELSGYDAPLPKETDEEIKN